MTTCKKHPKYESGCEDCKKRSEEAKKKIMAALGR